MKSVNTVIVGALLAMGLAGNAAAAPSVHASERGTVKLFEVKEASKHVAKKKVVQKVAKRAVNKAVVKRVASKKVAQQVAKKSNVKVYRVRPGDTLYRIAARNHTSVNKLIKINKLWGNKASNLQVGMKLRIA